MNTTELKQAILQAKKDTGTLILAHTYQAPDIIDIADISGDSFALSKAAAGMPEVRRVLLCGVRFMADTVKILSPEKEVVLPALWRSRSHLSESENSVWKTLTSASAPTSTPPPS